MAKMRSPRSLRRLCKLFIQGKDRRQGVHQDAQKSISVARHGPASIVSD
jgi:hypothetical protein